MHPIRLFHPVSLIHRPLLCDPFALMRDVNALYGFYRWTPGSTCVNGRTFFMTKSCFLVFTRKFQRFLFFFFRKTSVSFPPHFMFMYFNRPSVLSVAIQNHLRCSGAGLFPQPSRANQINPPPHCSLRCCLGCGLPGAEGLYGAHPGLYPPLQCLPQLHGRPPGVCWHRREGPPPR